jgi:anti-anti-sigma factor
MPVSEHTLGDRLVLSPQEALVAGGPAEEFERRVQTLFREGHRRLVTDLRAVPYVDSGGIRAFVRGHTTAQRLGGSFALASPNARVRTMLAAARLETVFEIFDTLEQARAREIPWRGIRIAILGTLLCGGLLFVGLRWPNYFSGISEGAEDAFITGKGQVTVPHHPFQPFIELSKLFAASLIGLLVTAIHRPAVRERQQGRSMEHAQTLLCISGAMMMVIIGSSLVRAFGIAGAASIIRFRTPVDDPKDVTILFLLMGLGMSTGVGAFAVAGLGTAFLCILLVILDHLKEQKSRAMLVEVVAEGREFPVDHVQSVFARHRIVFEPREISQGDEVTITYHAMLDPRVSLEEVSEQLMTPGKGVQSVAWEHAKGRSS